MILASVAAIATVITLAMPLLASDPLPRRMKSVALERDKIRQRERERMARGDKVIAAPKPETIHAAGGGEVSARQMGRSGRGTREAGAGAATAARRLMSRICSSAWCVPIAALVITPLYVFFILNLDLSFPDQDRRIRLLAAYLGMQMPWLFLEEQNPEAPIVDPPCFSRRARSAADLCRIRHVDRSRVQEGQQPRSARNR